MKQLLLSIFIFSSFAAYNQNYLFDGTIKGMDSGWIYIAHTDTTGKEYSYLNSSKIINNTFKFTGTVMAPEPCIFVFRPEANSIHLTSYFILDKGHTAGTLYMDSMRKSIVTGTASQDQFRDFLNNYDPLGEAEFLLSISLLQNPADSSLPARQKANLADQVALIQRSVKTNPASLVSAYIAERYFPRGADAKDLETIYSLIRDTDNFYSRRILMRIAAKTQTTIGHKAPSFSVIDRNNIEITDRSFSGKYYLIDFWASWCVPCRAENPFLLKAYNLFHKKGFDILSISLDDSKVYWNKALNEDKLPWKQACDFKVVQSPVVISFDINPIPANFLIDKNGIIVEKDLKGDQLIEVLGKYLKD